MSPVRRLAAVALVAGGVTLLAGVGIGLILGGVGLAWSGVELPVVAGVKRSALTVAARRRGVPPQHTLPEDPPAPAAATPYDEAA